MSMFNPADDPFLANLKSIALRGDSKEGRLYDKGVLAVVGRVERDGYYSVDPLGGILLLMGDQRLTASPLLTPEEKQEGARFLAQRGWSLDQGIEYAKGIKMAESILGQYRHKDNG